MCAQLTSDIGSYSVSDLEPSDVLAHLDDLSYRLMARDELFHQR